MNPSQPRLRMLSATHVTASPLPIPAVASAHSAVSPSATRNAVRGTLTPPSRSCDSASPANSRAASAWLHRMIVAAIGLTRAFRPQHDADRLEDEQQVEERRVVLRIIQVVFELLPAVLDRRAVGIIDLRPAGDAGLHHVALGVIIELLFQILHELRAFGARADEAHFALQHRPALRQLVEANLADESPDSRDAGIVLFGPHRLPADFGILAHRPQLDAVEPHAV